MKSFFISKSRVKFGLVNCALFLSFGLFAQINRGFLAAKPVVPAGYPPGTVQCAGSSTATVDVVSPTGKTWMDRNLGASQVATSSTDALAYGDSYQWGRFSDGHHCRTSGTTTTNSATDTPGHANFIIETTGLLDWRDPQNDNLWQGVNGVNNPCPIGYRIATGAEWQDEIDEWSPLNAAGAFNSVLKLPAAGQRYRGDGLFQYVGIAGLYWSSTINGTNAHYTVFFSTNAYLHTYNRASAYSVRCIKD